MKLLVTGAAGGLGRAFLKEAGSHHEIVAFDHASLDISDWHAVMRTMSAMAPEAVLNFGAMTKVDLCEDLRDEAARANAGGPQNVALAARACGAAVMHISTDYVFDGKKGSAYDETDATSPISHYGATKLAGELAVRAATPEHMIVRIGHVYGGGGDFLSRALEQMREGRPVSAIDDRRGTPTFVVDIARRLIPLLITRRWGTYHLASQESVSWFEIAQRLRAVIGAQTQVERISSDSLGLMAARPKDVSLRSIHLSGLGVEPMPTMDDSLREFASRLP